MWYEPLIKIVIAGAFGSSVRGLLDKRDYQLSLPSVYRAVERSDPKSSTPREWRVRLGFVGDIAVGCLASLGIFAVAGPIVDWDGIKTGQNLEKTVNVLAIALIAGFSGHGLVSAISEKFTKQALEQ